MVLGATSTVTIPETGQPQRLQTHFIFARALTPAAAQTSRTNTTETTTLTAGTAN